MRFFKPIATAVCTNSVLVSAHNYEYCILNKVFPNELNSALCTGQLLTPSDLSNSSQQAILFLAALVLILLLGGATAILCRSVIDDCYGDCNRPQIKR